MSLSWSARLITHSGSPPITEMMAFGGSSFHNLPAIAFICCRRIAASVLRSRAKVAARPCPKQILPTISSDLVRISSDVVRNNAVSLNFHSIPETLPKQKLDLEGRVGRNLLFEFCEGMLVDE